MLAAAGAAALGSSVASGAVLLGTQQLGPASDYNLAGTAEAFQTTASTSGTLGRVTVYLDTGTTASTVEVGVYASASGKPGSLLAKGTIGAPAASTWNDVVLSPQPSVSAGSSYWIALLSLSGTVRYRDSCCGGGSLAETHTTTTLGALPATWTTGSVYTDGPLSAYGSSLDGPALTVSPSSLAFASVVGGPSPAAQQISIGNGGGGILDWTVMSDAAWLTDVPGSGVGPGTVQVVASSSGLAAGTYTSSLTVTAAGAAGSPLSVPVTLTVSPAADTVVPVVSVVSPVAGAVVAGVVSVSANASDNVGVVGVQFKLDGANLGLEDTASPYSTSWDTTLASAGSHTLSAVARDAAGNSAGSSLVTVTVNNPPPPPPPPAGGPVAAYSFDAGSGSTLTDSSGNSNHGTIAGATWNTSGKYGSALSFTGTASNMVSVPDSNSLDLTSNLTLEAWINPSSLGTNWRTILLKETPGNLVYSLYANTNTTRPSTDLLISGTDRELRGPTALPLNSWSHLAATYDGTTQRLYLNGTQVASRPQTGPTTTSSGQLRIGANTIWTNEPFAGRIDDIRIYSRALTAAAIQTDMNTRVPATAPTAPAP